LALKTKSGSAIEATAATLNLRQICIHKLRGMSDDERLRLFYVAITRAKSRLYLTSYRQTLDGQRARHLSFLNITESGGQLSAEALPQKYSRINVTRATALRSKSAVIIGVSGHLPSYKPSLKSLLATRLESYKLSATHLNKFIDIESAGPQDFFVYYLLGLPQAPTTTTATDRHPRALAWARNQPIQER